MDAQEVEFNQFAVKHTGLQLRGPRFTMNQAIDIDFMRIRTPFAEIVVDNLSPAYRGDANVQLYQIGKTFSLRQNRTLSITDSYIAHRSHKHQVLISNFSAAHKLGEGRIHVQDITAASFAEQQVSKAIMTLRHMPIERRMVELSAWRPAVYRAVNVNYDVQGENVLEGKDAWTL